MKGLIVVHCETDPCQCKDDENHELLFEDIGKAIESYIENGDVVYLLGEDSESPDSEPIPVCIRRHSKRMKYIKESRRGGEDRFLETKEAVIEDGVDGVAVCGVQREVCVEDMYRLLCCEEGPEASMENYLRLATYLGWSRERFKRVFYTRVNATVIEELTDARFEN